MAALALRRLGARITPAILSGVLVAACGTDTSTLGAPGADGAPPSPSADGGPEDAAKAGDAGGAEGGACPATAPTYCLDCSGGGFCVSGTCPATTCPVRDAGPDAPASVDGSDGGSSDGARARRAARPARSAARGRTWPAGSLRSALRRPARPARRLLRPICSAQPRAIAPADSRAPTTSFRCPLEVPLRATSAPAFRAQAPSNAARARAPVTTRVAARAASDAGIPSTIPMTTAQYT
jgi:hypothetical protein